MPSYFSLNASWLLDSWLVLGSHSDVFRNSLNATIISIGYVVCQSEAVQVISVVSHITSGGALYEQASIDGDLLSE